MNRFHNRFGNRFAVVALLHLTFVVAAFGQGWPLPGKTPNVEVSCTACTGSSPAANGKTVGYRTPITAFTGRFLDSQATNEFQQPFRTARAAKIVLSSDGKRIYVQIGGMAAAYDTASFFTRLASGEALIPSTSVPLSVINSRPLGGVPEVFLRPDRFFYAEWGGGWQTPFVDGQARLNNFDVDDLGYLYLSHYVFGWGIVKDDLQTDGKLTLMHSQYQHFPYGDNGDQDPVAILSFKSGTQYFALINVTTQSEVWNVTNRSNPVRVATLRSLNFSQAAKNATGDRIAITDGTTGNVNIYSADSLAVGGAPMATFTPGLPYVYTSVASDGINFYGSFTKPTLKIAVFTPSGSSFVQQSTFDTGTFVDSGAIRANAGYLTVITSNGVLLYKITSSLGFTEVPLKSSYPGTDVKTDSYFSQYYFNFAPAGYGFPHFYVHSADAAVINSGGKTYLVYTAGGLADVYEIQNGAVSTSLCDDPSNVCLDGNRFAVHIDWNTNDGKSGVGTPIKYSDNSGLFWFFGADNLEVLVKVLDGCALNNHHWVFAAAATDTAYTITITDTLTGRVKTYSHHGGSAAPAIIDTGSLACSP